jgi:hypothetical protein
MNKTLEIRFLCRGKWKWIYIIVGMNYFCIPSIHGRRSAAKILAGKKKLRILRTPSQPIIIWERGICMVFMMVRLRGSTDRRNHVMCYFFGNEILSRTVAFHTLLTRWTIFIARQHQSSLDALVVQPKMLSKTTPPFPTNYSLHMHRFRWLGFNHNAKDTFVFVIWYNTTRKMRDETLLALYRFYKFCSRMPCR